ncbi:MAG TPA: alpha-amylase family glycosyl hydrolase [Phototrophicaceae bacterium]|jgi:glycosidase|nr:alpha-amylase family glycosyl hydrolase [Phototrophicaceae bacterium]
MKKRNLILFILMICLSGFHTASPTATVSAQDGDSGQLFWWNDRVFYQIFVRSFYDSDGDGIGDLQGVIQKLDYLNDGDPTTTTDLGVTGIWLMPIMPSPSYHGYDVTDYYDVNPDYGTKADFSELMTEAHKRGIAVIIDLVLNHTSSQHPWFIASQNGDPKYQDYYVWSDTDPGYKGPDNQTVWYKKNDRYYYAVFWSEMPDLNYQNAAVTAQMYDVSHFWLQDMGVDGFRLDAVKYFVEDGRAGENTSLNHDWLQAYHAYVHSVKPDALLVGEIWDSANLVLPYTGNEMDIAFAFDLAHGMVQAASFGLPNTLAKALQPMIGQYPPGQYATFLTNHDQDRFFSQLRSRIDYAKLGVYIYLTLPGVPFVYYGEEIGMEGKRTKSDTDAERRSPMQWDGSENAGFTTGTPWFPVNGGFSVFNVETEAADPTSLFNAYRNLIQIRDATPALQYGDFTPVESVSKKVFSFLRQSDGQTVLVVINMDDREVTDYGLSADTSALTDISVGQLLFTSGDAPADTLSAPEVNDQGGFEGYLPLVQLEPFSITLIEW